ncbi:MAG: hypothetical protein HY761_07400 [Candidatus Omnitrophica bacterium]|nr:hypothetical protein [Candidatus Omnitrophota bacterium]
MKFLNEKEAKEWLTKRGITADKNFNNDSLKKEFKNNITYLIPKDTGKKTALARIIADIINENEDGCYLITDFGIYPSCDNRDIFNAYRATIGESRQLIDIPCHIFTAGELKELECLIALTLFFYYDSILVESPQSSISLFKFSHDEYVSVYTRDDKKFYKFKELLEKFGLVTV